MKRFLALLAVCALALTGYSQTNSPIIGINTNTSPPTLEGPLISGLNSLTTASNLTAGVYGTYVPDTQEWGAGLAAIYNLNDTLGTMLRGDFVGSQFWMVSGNLQLQAPVTIANKVKLTFFGSSGIATPLGGAGEKNGSVQGIFTAGLDVKIPGVSDSWSTAFALEKWTAMEGVQFHFSPLVWKF